MAVLEKALVGDVGGTKMAIGVASAEGIIEEVTIETPQKDSDLLFRAIGRTAKRLVTKHDLKAGAVGFPGPNRPSAEGILTGPFQNIDCINEPFKLSERLEAETPELKGFDVFALNDAEAQTHEAPHILKGSDLTDMVVTFFTHSTGVGGDSIRNGKVLGRPNGMTGEYGHIPFWIVDQDHEDGGYYATLENRVSGNAIKEIDGNGGLDAKALGSMPESQDGWDRVGKEFGRGISVLVPVLGTNYIVIGGGVSRSHHRYMTALESELEHALSVTPPHIVEEFPIVNFVPRDLIGTLGMRGAFRAAQQKMSEIG